MSGPTFSIPGRCTTVYLYDVSSNRHLAILLFFILLVCHAFNMNDTLFWSVTRVKCFPISKCLHFLSRGEARHFHLGGPLEGPVLQQGVLSMVCVGLSERDLKNFGGATGGVRKNFWGEVDPWHPPSSAPVSKCFCHSVGLLFNGGMALFARR